MATPESLNSQIKSNVPLGLYQIVPTYAITYVSGNHNVTTSDSILIVDTSGGPIQIDLDANLLPDGKMIVIKDNGGAGINNINIFSSAYSIDGGGTTLTIVSAYGSVTMFFTGAKWLVTAII